MVIWHPLHSWFPSPVPARMLPAGPHRVFPALDQDWRHLIPGYEACVAFTQMGLPFHSVLEGSHDTEPDHERIPEDLKDGRSIVLLQPHEVMPRLARLMVALRATFFGPFFKESSYLFMTEGLGRPGMALHHDGDTHCFWLQLEGRRTVTLGPPAAEGSEIEPDSIDPSGPGWTTLELTPGSLFYMAPRILHRVVCRERSLALSLTLEPLRGSEVLSEWLERVCETNPAILADLPRVDEAAAFGSRLESNLLTLVMLARQLPYQGNRFFLESLTEWPVAEGRAVRALPGVSEPFPVPPPDSSKLWTHRPAGVWFDEAGTPRLVAEETTIPISGPLDPPLLDQLRIMSCGERSVWGRADSTLAVRLESEGVLSRHDLPVLIYPDDVDSLEGWDFRKSE